MFTRLGSTITKYNKSYCTSSEADKILSWVVIGAVTWGGYGGFKGFQSSSKTHYDDPADKTFDQVFYAGSAAASGVFLGGLLGCMRAVGVFGIPIAITSLYMYNKHQMKKKSL